MRRYVAIVLSSVLGLQAAPLLLASVASAAPAVRASAQAPATGTVEGTARDVDGKVLPRQGVQLRNLDTNQVVATTSSSGDGTYSFERVPPANYVVELIDSKTGAVIGASSAVAVTAGTTTTMTVAATTAVVQGTAVAGGAAAGGAAAGGAAAGGAAAGAAAAGAAAGGMGIGISTALVVATVATAAGVAGVVVARENPSPSN
jgi:hypothetical protein